MANHYTFGIGQPHTDSDDAPPAVYATDDDGNVTGLVGPDGGAIIAFSQSSVNGIDLLSPGNGVTPTASVGAGATLNSSGFTTVNGEQWFGVNVTATSGSNNHVEINIPTFTALAADVAVVEYQTDTSQGSPMVLYLGTTSYSVFATGQKSLSAANTSDPFMSAGPTVATLHKAVWNKNATYTRDTIEQQWVIAKLRVTVTNGQTRNFYLRSIKVGCQARKGRLCVVADDGYASFLRSGVPILDRYGIRSTMAIIADKVGAATYATLAELQAYVAAGNICVPHGPIGGTGNLWTTYTTNAQRIADINYHRDFLLQNGLSGPVAAKCYVWPQGVWNAGNGETSMLDEMTSAGYLLARAATAYPSKSGSLAAHPVALLATSSTNQIRLRVPIIGHDYNGATNTPDDVNETANVDRIIATIQEYADSGVDGFLMLHKVVARGAAASGGLDIEVDRLSAIAAAIQTEVASGKLETVLMPEMVTY